MVDFSLNPAYNARAAAGQVQTPGLVDWGGLGQRLYDDLLAPMVPRAPTVQPTQAQMQAMRNIPGSIPASTYSPSIRTAQGTPERLPTEMGYGPASASNPAVVAIQQATGTVPGGGRVTGYEDDPLFGLATPSPKVNRLRPATPVAPNQQSGSVVAGKDQSQLTPNAFGYGTNGVTGVNPAVAAIQQATGTVPRGIPVYNRSRDSLSYAAAGRNAVANMPPVTANSGDGIIDLGDAFSPKASQGFADSEGKPVRVKGVIYYPAGKAPAATRQSAPQSQGQATSGGWMSALFGGNSGGGGLLRNMLQNTASAMSGPSSIGSSPSQGQAMTVNPGTSSGQTLSSMGFSDGALVPAATIRGLESRGYFR
jgi:hypothetical protein